MKVIRAFSTDDGLYKTIKLLHKDGEYVELNSRNGPVRRFNEPATIVWENPMRRVSFNAIRDANPVFHLFEAFWMLSGEEDVERPAYFAPHLASFSDDGVTLAGAYGFRWREHWEVDQLEDYIIPSLTKNKEDRRCVLQMWDTWRDIDNGKVGGKDLCCNISVMFDASMGRLDMMVTNRSNDIVLGATGANIVHFSFLQEYVAGCIGIPIGRYSQVSNNSHAYVENEQTKKVIHEVQAIAQSAHTKIDPNFYMGQIVDLFDDDVEPVTMQGMIDRDIQELMDKYNQLDFEFESTFFATVVAPVIRAFNLYKDDKLEQAIQELEAAYIQSDWLIATKHWLMRRVEIRNRKIDTLFINKATVTHDDWEKALLQVWPSAILGPFGMGLDLYETEVWVRDKIMKVEVGSWHDGQATIRQRGLVE
jgi:thymidylate synthase